MKLKMLIGLSLLNLSMAFGQEYTPLFDGSSLEGWKVVNEKNAKYWSVIDGVITASNGDQKMPTNTYLATEKQYQNFSFSCKFRLSGDHSTGLINSGIQYRSLLVKQKKNPKVVKIVGYQADIGKGYWGDIYDEHRRRSLLKANTTELFKDFKEDGWNDYKIICKGSRHQLFINDHLTAEYSEADPKIETLGVIALQLHSGGVAKMEYKDINIIEYPPTKMELPREQVAQDAKIHGKGVRKKAKELVARDAKIHGKGMRYQAKGDMIVSWNKTSDYLEWSVPAHITPGKYEIILNYSCDTKRQGSELVFASKGFSKEFKTKGLKAKWSPVDHSMGVVDIQASDSLTLKCTSLKADWVLDFHRIMLKPAH